MEWSKTVNSECRRWRSRLHHGVVAPGGTRATLGTGDPIVVITSVGARSGKLRQNLAIRVEHDGRYLAVASKGGADDDPVCAHTFLAHPEVDYRTDPTSPHLHRPRATTRTRARRVVAASSRDLADIR
jgi:deazaflavin-dependent oxidoreductase (nitroreductase family)